MGEKGGDYRRAMEDGEGVKFKNNADFGFLVCGNCLKMVKKKLIIEKLIYYQVLLGSEICMLSIGADFILWICLDSCKIEWCVKE